MVWPGLSGCGPSQAARSLAKPRGVQRGSTCLKRLEVQARLLEKEVPIRRGGVAACSFALGRNDGELDEPPARIDDDLGHPGLDGSRRQIRHPRYRKWTVVGAEIGQGQLCLSIREGDRIAREISAHASVSRGPAQEVGVREKGVREIRGFRIEPDPAKDLSRALAQNGRRLFEPDPFGDVRSRRERDRQRERATEREKEATGRRGCDHAAPAGRGDHLRRRRLAGGERRGERIAARQRRRDLRRRRPDAAPGSFSRQRRITRSTAGSKPGASVGRRRGRVLRRACAGAPRASPRRTRCRPVKSS